MQFKYTILKAEPRHKILHVRYSAEGRDDFHKAFNPNDWSEENILNLINEFAPTVLAHWVYQESAPESSPIDVDVEFTADNEPSPIDYIHDHFEVPPLSERRRMLRNVLLQETDHYALTDTVEMSPEMVAYRQALRDVPEQEQFPDVVAWPKKPE